MLKNLLFLVMIGFCVAVSAQEVQSPYQSKKFRVDSASIAIDSVSINPSFFEIKDKSGNVIDKSFYTVDYTKSSIQFIRNDVATDSITVNYLPYPKFITKEYSIYDQSRVVSNDAGNGTLFKSEESVVSNFKPFDGLNTSGSITRGITVGNNQNAVVNSNLDLQITGKISDKVGLRASIQDSNIPLQEGGYSQKLDEFDQIFIELFSDKWNIRAGDLFLENRQSRFLNFNKKVQGLSANFTFGGPENKTNVFGAAALVRGQYARSNFTGQEGNQGPYKLTGSNGELYVLVISGSERVYVNGILLTRGENNDYVIDYNAGEITFTTLFPITSEMRINVEYQYSDRNYTRFVTYAGAEHTNKNWSLAGYLYSENDVKNQPLQQSLSAEQVAILKQAGDDISAMVAPSAYEDSFSENKILYKKTIVNGVETFEYSNNSSDVLFNVRFSLVGANQGNYILASNAAVGKIYSYVAPVNGILQGNYEPQIRLIAPTKIQVATVMGKYSPNEKTKLDFEIGVSNNDMNLFSSEDDDDNKGIAAKIFVQQRLFTKETWQLEAFADLQFVQKEFTTIERLYTIEFNRDWNLTTAIGDQSFLVTGINANLKDKGKARYQLEKLDFSESFSGTRHILDANLKLKELTVQTNSSALNSKSDYADSEFFRSQSQARYHFGKNWVGASLRHENNKEKINSTQTFSALSQKFTEYGAFLGRGDSTKVFAEIGYLRRSNDSLVANVIQKVNNSDSYYLKSRLVKTEKSDLQLFVNYRNLVFENNQADEPSLNSRVLYNDRFFDQLMQVSAAYETTSGTIAQQEFTYLEVESGRGIYTWIDYNGNGIQELEEFEVAQFSDQAKFVRIFLPNQVFVKTHQNKFSTSLNLNPIQWQNEKGFKKLLSYFYNQTSFLIDRKIFRDGTFDLNPFSETEEDLLGLNSSFRNSLFYNRGKQDHSLTYTYLQNRVRNLLSVGSQETESKSHQLQYLHLFKKSWLVGLNVGSTKSALLSENYGSKNFQLDSYQAAPKISYLFSKNTSWDLFYEFKDKKNTISDFESLQQHRIGTAFTFNSEKKFSMNGEFSLYKNDFEGNALSAVAYQMLEGLQPGQNLTWRLLLQKNLTQFLDVNINYEGRKSEDFKAIHTGNVQLRAYF